MNPYQEIAVIFIVLAAMFIVGTWFFGWCAKKDIEQMERDNDQRHEAMQRLIAEEHCKKVLRKRYMTSVESEGGHHD